MDRRTDGARPRPELGRDQLDAVEGRRLHPLPQLAPDRPEQQVGRPRTDPAADDHPVGRDDGDHVRDADPEVAADLGEAIDGSCLPGARPGHGLLGRRGSAGRRDPVRTGECLDAASVSAAAQRPLGIDRLVADLAGRAVVALVDPSIDRDHPADARPERQPDHRGRATAGTEPQLGKPERPRVVDEDRRQADRLADRAGDGLAGPRTGDVDEEPRRAGRRVVQPRHADPDARCRPAAPDRFGRHLAELGDHGRRHVLRGAGQPRGHLLASECCPLAAGLLDHRPLEVRGPEVEAEMPAGLRGTAGRHQVSPVTRA